MIPPVRARREGKGPRVQQPEGEGNTMVGSEDKVAAGGGEWLDRRLLLKAAGIG